MRKKIILLIVVFSAGIILFGQRQKNNIKPSREETVQQNKLNKPEIGSKQEKAQPYVENSVLEPVDGDLNLLDSNEQQIDPQANQQAVEDAQIQFEDFQRNQQYMKERQEGLSKNYE